MKITIITVCHNSASYLEFTILSVVKQTFKDWEYIIIDGASTDSTVSIIRKYEHQLSYWISEPDEGMYHAINKGLAKATGEYFLILNSDDYLYSSNVLDEVHDYLKRHQPKVAFGNLVKEQDGKQKKVRLFPAGYEQLLLSTHGTFVPHPATFVSAQLHHDVLKEYDCTFRYASDYDYILRALKSNDGRHLPIYVSVFRMHTGSITASGKIDAERLAILKVHGYYSFGFIHRKFAYLVLWIKYKILNLNHRFMASKFWA